ncbi:protein FAM234B [Tachysurus fulvidraco]|uniref:protein FAM234B n=1 Tax=Tachysurus fulvidraco TaxID=1234273 RepID=UPI001FEFD624|nr:protein FAM234B [Tachysurus fulvidraco]XP_047672205.1 protein FAM234B [Tachysurus fulvidraco]
MATALSRALKLPGKKGSELGEYDPLTQVDSEDDSEEDDLVLNYPRNGLTSHSRTATLRLGQEGAELQEEDEDEGDTWRHGGGKDRRCKAGGVADDSVGLVSEEAGQKAKVQAAVRTAAFVVPLIGAAMFVLLFAFLLPCQRRGSQRQNEWETEVGHAGGVTSPPMALWDVDGDGVEDLLLSVMRINNSSQQISYSANIKEYSVVALHGVNGSVMWTRSLKEPLSSVQCSAPNTCLLITSTLLSSVNASTGKKLWEVPAGDEVVSQAVAVPDVQGDSVPDLLIATVDQESVISLVLHSGLTGSLIGQPVNFNFTTQGKLIGPLLHETVLGAYYILLGIGKVEAVSLRDVYRNVTGHTTAPPSLSVKDPVWEKQRKNNSSTLIPIYSGVDQVLYFLPLVTGVCNNHNNLDVDSSRNSSRSDWVVVSVNSQISVIRERDIHTTWTVNSSSIHSHPAVGYFNDDGVPDLLIQQSANGIRKVQIIDGAQGQILWEAEFVCPRLVLEGSTILTTSGQSAFLFWAGDPLPLSKNVTKVSPPEPFLRRLFLLHPAYPTILQELTSTTDTALTSAVSYDDEQKDVSYVVVVSRPVSGLGPGVQLVKSVSVSASLTSATTVRLSDDTHTRAHTTFQINKFFRSLAFRRQ